MSMQYLLVFDHDPKHGVTVKTHTEFLPRPGEDLVWKERGEKPVTFRVISVTHVVQDYGEDVQAHTPVVFVTRSPIQNGV